MKDAPTGARVGTCGRAESHERFSIHIECIDGKLFGNAGLQQAFLLNGTIHILHHPRIGPL
jgi:hypothetical protein